MSDHYRYATGGQTYACLDCGSLVEEESRDLHDGWHVDVATLDDLDASERGQHIIWTEGRSA